MADHFEYDVFLSHSAKDKAVVRELAERLREDGVVVWFDEWVLKPGDSIAARIEEGSEHSRVLVFCMSANAFGSDWAQLESGTYRFRDPLNKDRRFLPLRLDDAPIKGSLAQFLYINWLPANREQEYPKLLQACRPAAKVQRIEARHEREQAAEKAIQLDYTSLGAIVGYAFSPDGKQILSAANEDLVRVWDTETGRCVRVLEGHNAYVWAVAWSTDQQRALSASRDKTIRLWEIESGQCLRMFQGHKHEVVRVAWSRESERSGRYSPTRNERIERLKRDLQTMTMPSVQFSAVARAFLLHDDRKWVRMCVA